MNRIMLIGRLTREPEIRWSAGDNNMAIARYTLAVDRRYKRQGDEQTADFINCIAFGKTAEFAEKYLHKGIKIAVTGRLQSSNYTNKEGKRIYMVQVVAEEQEFAQSRPAATSGTGFNNSVYPDVPSEEAQYQYFN